MIDVGIIGTDDPVAARLVRLLLLHPEVRDIIPVSPNYAGRPLSEAIPGLLGEREISFASTLNPEKVNLLIACGPDYAETAKREFPEELRYIDLTGAHLGDYADFGMEYGLSEINRKPLVRGAKRAVVPSNGAVPALVALAPLAHHLILKDEVKIDIHGAVAVNPADEIKRELSKIQLGFQGDIQVNLLEADPGEERIVRMKCDLPCNIDLDEIMKMYDSIYDDHNFTIYITRNAPASEVAGTHKCVVSVTKPNEGILHLEAITDANMRGGASEAIHLMNLLFALHERTGLQLAASL